MSKIIDWLNRFNTDIWYGERHRWCCPFKNKRITIIDNADGRKIHEGNRKYCFYCGAKLRDI